MCVEEMGARFYREVAAINVHDKVKEVCLLLADEEDKHREAFSLISKQKPKKAKTHRHDCVLDMAKVMQKMADWIQEKIFTLKTSEALTVTSPELLAVALKMEEDSIGVYEELHSIFMDNTKRVLEKIIYEEKQHLIMLLNVKEVVKS